MQLSRTQDISRQARKEKWEEMLFLLGHTWIYRWPRASCQTIGVL